MVQDTSDGRRNLERARYFLSKLEECERSYPLDLKAADAYLHATIVFGKTVMDWLADRYGPSGLSSENTRKQWLKSVGQWTETNAYVAESRDFAVHDDGSVETFAATNVTAHAGTGRAFAQGGVHVARVIPPNPTPEELAILTAEWEEEDKRVRRMREDQQKQREQWQEQVAKEDRGGSVTYSSTLRFTDPRMDNRAAVPALREYLNDVERLLSTVGSLDA